METKRKVHNILTLVFYFTVIAAYVKIFATGEVFIYLRARYAYLSVLVILFIVFLSIFSLSLLLVKKKVMLRFKTSYLVLFIPFMIAIFHTPTGYSIQTIQKKMRTYRLEKNPVLSEKFEASHDKKKDLIIINKDNFYHYIYEFYKKKRFRNYESNPFVIRGIYFRNSKHFFDNHAFVGRLIMSCCAADAVMDGFFLKFENKLPDIDPGKWIEVKGKLVFEKTREDGFMPVLTVTSYKKIAAEKTSYILPVHF
jgi:uncharacterized repeat protein (TIGR03943 family)